MKNYNFKKIREEKQLTRKSLAELVGCSTRAISYIENGERKPKLSTALKISKVLGVDIEKIFDI